jgi:hypothetical protein
VRIVADPKGYYRILGLVPAATHDEVADVYWRLEKEWRVGPNRETGGVARKKAMDEAFRVLGDPDRRVLYDAQCISHGLATNPAVAGKPIRCQICKRVAAQPRYLVFWGVVSRVYAASRRPTQGIFCAACARKVSWAATAATSLRGWWSPWGLVWAPAYGLRNVMGGQKPPGLECELAWRNALAFQRAGNIPLAAALAGRVASLKGPHSDEARRLQEKLIAASGKAPPKLLDPWKARPLDLIGRSLLLFLAPLLIVILAVMIGLSVAGGHGPVGDSAVPPMAARAPATTTPAPQAQGPCSVVTLSQADQSSGNCQDIGSGEPSNTAAVENAVVAPEAPNYTPFDAPHGIQRPRLDDDQ